MITHEHKNKLSSLTPCALFKCYCNTNGPFTLNKKPTKAHQHLQCFLSDFFFQLQGQRVLLYLGGACVRTVSQFNFLTLVEKSTGKPSIFFTHQNVRMLDILVVIIKKCNIEKNIVEFAVYSLMRFLKIVFKICLCRNK